MKKPTRWMTNLPELIESLGVRCNNASLPPAKQHVHHMVMGSCRHGKRSELAAIYPMALVETILKALVAHKEQCKNSLHTL